MKALFELLDAVNNKLQLKEKKNDSKNNQTKLFPCLCIKLIQCTVVQVCLRLTHLNTLSYANDVLRVSKG